MKHVVAILLALSAQNAFATGDVSQFVGKYEPVVGHCKDLSEYPRVYIRHKGDVLEVMAYGDEARGSEIELVSVFQASVPGAVGNAKRDIFTNVYEDGLDTRVIYYRDGRKIDDSSETWTYTQDVDTLLIEGNITISGSCLLEKVGR